MWTALLLFLNIFTSYANFRRHALYSYGCFTDFFLIYSHFSATKVQTQDFRYLNYATRITKKKIKFMRYVTY